MTTPLKGAFTSKYDLPGSDWIRRIDPDDRAVLVRTGFSAAGYGVTGGRARAKNARRDYRGRFISDTAPAPEKPTAEQIDAENRRKWGVAGIDF